MPEPARPLRVVMASVDPRHPGGIVAVVDSWRAAGLAERVALTEVYTSAVRDPLPRKLAQAARAVPELLRLLARRPRPDLVHLHSSTGGSLLRKLALSWCCSLARVPYVVQMHSGAFEAWTARSPLHRALARSLFSRAALVIVLAERWREAALSLGARRVEVLANGIPVAEAAALAAAGVGAAPRTAGEPPVLLFYGRWAPVKGLDLLGEALRGLDRRDYELRIFGAGDRAWLEAALAGVPGKVSILGWLEGERRAAELAGAAALLSPSRSEGFPVALVEARAAGTPVIAADVGAVAEALAGYAAATLLPPGDAGALRAAIARLLDDDPPGERSAGQLPVGLLAEGAVDRLVEIYGSVSPGR